MKKFKENFLKFSEETENVEKFVDRSKQANN